MAYRFPKPSPHQGGEPGNPKLTASEWRHIKYVLREIKDDPNTAEELRIKATRAYNFAMKAK